LLQPKTGPLSDEESQWLATLYASNFASVFKACRGVLQSTEDAADATHEVFLRAVQAAPRGALRIDSRAWLLAVARNYCCDLLRRRERLGRALVTLAAGSDHPAEVEAEVVDRQMLDRILGQLRVRERQVLWQSAVEHRPLGEIARRLGLSYVAAAQLLHRARKRAWLVAARLAAIMGLWRCRRQLSGNVSAAMSGLIAASVVPVFLVTIASSEPGHHAAPLEAAYPAVIGSAPLPTTVSAGNAPLLTRRAGELPPAMPVNAVSGLPSVPLPQAGKPGLTPLVTTVEQTVSQIAGDLIPDRRDVGLIDAPTLPVSVPSVEGR
jgi:RNA polymerase sigma-70 factor, ECF subfamily